LQKQYFLHTHTICYSHVIITIPIITIPASINSSEAAPISMGNPCTPLLSGIVIAVAVSLSRHRHQ